MVDETDVLALDALESHPKGGYRIFGVQRRPDTPAHDLLAVSVEDQKQVAEVIAASPVHHLNVGYVTDPKLVGRRRDKVLDEVGIRRQAVRGVGGAWLAPALAHLEAVLVDDPAEAVAAYRTVAAELLPVHVPQLHASYAGVPGPDAPDVLEGELLPCGLAQGQVLVVLVICLLALAKQHAQPLDVVSPGVLCAQVPHCLVPVFFRIGILYRASAIFIISS